MIVDDILKRFSRYLSDIDVEILDYCVCARYAYCLVGCGDKKALGLALVMYPDIFSEQLSLRPTLENLIDGFIKGGILTRTLFLSCINAISQYIFWHQNHSDVRVFKRNLIDFIGDFAKRDSKIVVIGNMRPLVRKLLDNGYQNVVVFERDPILRGKEALPEYFEFRYLQDADIAIITGCTILNDTLDLILRYTRRGATKILVGPTAQLFPQVLLDYVDLVGSLRVLDIPNAIESLRRGGGRWVISDFSEDYIVERIR